MDTLLQPAELSKSMSRSSSILGIPASNPIKNIVLNDPSGISFLALKKLQQLQYEDNFTLHNNHFVTKDKKTLLLFVAPSLQPVIRVKTNSSSRSSIKQLIV
ncbi:hypothetical protein [Niabella hibiscisoli]|uniref:hypothetical protein n=1 Tax=Niabella hibiscisoli TaxID=1825928 RepID=UPI001F0FC80A|nr:hypothetical protein [Niabella hibiscisoli]MCH5715890.1 hypothetical protein [Niabella hibiscisoli]